MKKMEDRLQSEHQGAQRRNNVRRGGNRKVEIFYRGLITKFALQRDRGEPAANKQGESDFGKRRGEVIPR